MASLPRLRLFYKTVHRTFALEARLNCTSTRRWNSSTSSQFTVFVDPKLDKGLATKQLSALGPPTSSSSDAAVVLTTPSFARWLEDESVMRALLGPAPSALQVLSGVVDGLSPSSTFSMPREGFSVLRGNADTLLPRLWLHDSPQAQKPEKSHGYLDFCAQTPDGLITTTMPLANTVFFTGQEATLSASSWLLQDGVLTRQDTMHKAFQQIVLPGVLASHRINAPLIPILPSRKITGCLGNILSEIEVNGQSITASTELEDIVPKIYNKRMAATPDSVGVEVWAVVSPSTSPASCHVQQDVLSLFDDKDNESAVAVSSSRELETLFRSGCELYRIESGGGGWGKRKGRLALETKWTPSSPTPSVQSASLNDSEEIDFPAFMRQGIKQRGLITPGSWLQFFVSPLPPCGSCTSSSAPLSTRPTRNVVLGSAQSTLSDHVIADHANIETMQAPVKLMEDHFSGLAAEGLFITKEDKSSTQLESPFGGITLRYE
ncbi:v-type c subunit family protein [Ceratocystis lukuohia]|uniref:V-type c subunit family protein n=1 Tax=Ceratocystis lukuohia TaxID=2019550 RepID=A0ABR4MTT8_9PEZI